MPSQTERDLGEHFSRRLHNLVVDTVDTCQHTDLSHSDIVSLVITGLLYEVNIAAVAMRLSEREFLMLCATTYRHMQKRVEKLRAEEEGG